jgi:hypothetical protein
MGDFLECGKIAILKEVVIEKCWKRGENFWFLQRNLEGKN